MHRVAYDFHTAEQIWGESTYVRQNNPEPITEAEADTAAAASDAYMSAVEGSEYAAETEGYKGAVGSFVRQRWEQVRPCYGI